MLTACSQFLLPGLVDTHVHAPQYMNSGVGYDRMLLEWLDTYTFPTEARFRDIEVAGDVYPKVVVHAKTAKNNNYLIALHNEAIAAKDIYVHDMECFLLQKRTLEHGTTTACYFATIHLEASKELCKVVGKFISK